MRTGEYLLTTTLRDSGRVRPSGPIRVSEVLTSIGIILMWLGAGVVGFKAAMYLFPLIWPQVGWWQP